MKDYSVPSPTSTSKAKGFTITPSRSEWLNQWARSGSPTSLPIESPIVTQYPADHTLCTDDSIVVILQSGSTSLCPEHICTFSINLPPNRIPVDWIFEIKDWQLGFVQLDDGCFVHVVFTEVEIILSIVDECNQIFCIQITHSRFDCVGNVVLPRGLVFVCLM